MCSTIIICHTWSKSIDTKHRELSILEAQNLSKESVDSTMALLDQIINDIFSRYVLMNIEAEQVLYINEEMIHRIMFNVMKEAYLSMSPLLMNRLASIYNRDYMDDIVAKKIQMITMSYVISVNGTYKN